MKNRRATPVALSFEPQNSFHIRIAESKSVHSVCSAGRYGQTRQSLSRTEHAGRQFQWVASVGSQWILRRVDHTIRECEKYLLTNGPLRIDNNRVSALPDGRWYLRLLIDVALL